jgi:polyhydroxyalkanoate synthesis repressor PhaR
MSDIRIIKKYPNRRLYDTHISRYITLPDVKKMVEGYIPFKIIDSKTNEDITRNTLLQVITEEEEKGTPIFTSELLLNTIRFYGDSTQAQISRFLEHSLQHFTEHKGELKGPMSSLGKKDGSSKLKKITEKNLTSWDKKKA